MRGYICGGVGTRTPEGSKPYPPGSSARAAMKLGSGAGWMSASTSVTWRLTSVAAGLACVLGVDDNVVLLDVDRERLGDVGTGDPLAALDGHVVALDARLAGPQERLALGQIVLPSVPGTGEQRGVGVHAELARAGRQRPRCDASLAQRASLVRAAIADPVEAIADAEDADRSP